MKRTKCTGCNNPKRWKLVRGRIAPKFAIIPAPKDMPVYVCQDCNTVKAHPAQSSGRVYNNRKDTVVLDINLPLALEDYAYMTVLNLGLPPMKRVVEAAVGFGLRVKSLFEGDVTLEDLSFTPPKNDATVKIYPLELHDPMWWNLTVAAKVRGIQEEDAALLMIMAGYRASGKLSTLNPASSPKKRSR